MPLIVHPRKSGARALVLLAAAMLTMLSMAHSALAASSCSVGNPSPVFSQFGDTSNYLMVPGGNFEASNTNKWTLTKESLVAGNEPFYVGSSKDTQSLSLTSGGTAESPGICLDATRPFWRFVASSHNGSTASTLSVWAQWKDSTGKLITTPKTTLAAADYQGWAVTPQLTLATALGDGTASITANLFFSTTGKWQIDDVYVDPYRVA
jgi:hypothetical protein